MVGLTIKKVNVLPETFVKDTLYLVKSAGAEHFDLYASDSDGLTVRHIPTKDEITSSVMLYGEEPPALPNPVKLWWNTVEGTLYVQYNDGNATYWVEAMPSIAVPEFAGTGQASTMARSDHDHDEEYVQIGSNEW